MRTGYFYSLIFALLTSTSITAVAAETVKPQASHPPAVATTSSGAQSGKINLNAADAATLHKELLGVGEAKALAIVAHRDTNGPFASVDELLEVKGIGKAILDRNRDKLEVN
jgi:competence protein ComEA